MGTPRIFGVPGGGSSLALMDAAREVGLPFVLTRGETAACIMAAVTGELTGVPGAALTGLGPGAASAVSGVAHAWLDRSPMIVITDRHPGAGWMGGLDGPPNPPNARSTPAKPGRSSILRHAPGIDQAALFAPVTKASLTIEAESAGHGIAHAGQLAMTEPRGPVHLDVAADVAGRAALPVATSVRPAALPPPGRDALDAAARLLGGAARPVIIAGLQCRGHQASKWLRAFAETRPAPVLVTGKAKGVLPDPHPLMLGIFTGGVSEEALLGRADLIVAIGLDPVELIPRAWSPAVPVLHLAPAPLPFAHLRPAVEVVGDIELILEELAPRLRAGERADWDVAELDRLKRDVTARLAVATRGLAPHRVVQIARELTPAGTIATVDSGVHMVAATVFWQAVSPGEFLISNGLATMGFALPAAIAAQLVQPERRVLCFTGAAGLLMAVAELETAARLALPLLVVVFDDGALSRVDLRALARSFGVAAFVADSEETLRRAVVLALAAPGPALIDARIDPSGYRAMLEQIRGV
jgi:acetolactate synthase-1/2/3 large subunit